MIWNDTAFIRLNQWILNDPAGQVFKLKDFSFSCRMASSQPEKKY
jgi:hypothetical protein